MPAGACSERIPCVFAVGMTIDLTGHGYNAKVQGPIGRGVRAWRVRREDGGSDICVRIAEREGMLNNPHICKTDATTGAVTYCQKMWLVEMDCVCLTAPLWCSLYEVTARSSPLAHLSSADNLTKDLYTFFQNFASNESIAKSNEVTLQE